MGFAASPLKQRVEQHNSAITKDILLNLDHRAGIKYVRIYIEKDLVFPDDLSGTFALRILTLATILRSPSTSTYLLISSSPLRTSG
jgi:hypothetical protein